MPPAWPDHVRHDHGMSNRRNGSLGEISAGVGVRDAGCADVAHAGTLATVSVLCWPADWNPYDRALTEVVGVEGWQAASAVTSAAARRVSWLRRDMVTSIASVVMFLACKRLTIAMTSSSSRSRESRTLQGCSTRECEICIPGRFRVSTLVARCWSRWVRDVSLAAMGVRDTPPSPCRLRCIPRPRRGACCGERARGACCRRIGSPTCRTGARARRRRR